MTEPTFRTIIEPFRIHSVEPLRMTTRAEREAAVAKAKALGAAELFLESSSKLTTAIRLYETSGFVHTPPPGASHYERADVYMVYRG